MRYLSGPQMQRAYECVEDRIPKCQTCKTQQYLENGIVEWGNGRATMYASCMRDHGRTAIELSVHEVEYIGRADFIDLRDG